jgi:hypothetical protein
MVNELNNAQVDSIMGTDYSKEEAPFIYGPGHSDYEQRKEGLMHYLKGGGYKGLQSNIKDSKVSDSMINSAMNTFFKGQDWDLEEDLVNRYSQNPNDKDFELAIHGAVMSPYTDNDGKLRVKGGLEALSKNSKHDPSWKGGNLERNVYAPTY